MANIFDLLTPNEQPIYERLESKFSPADAIWYLKRLCYLKPSYCGSGRQALEDTCSKSSGLDSNACNVIIDQVMEKYCSENKNSRACKNESFPGKDGGITLASDALAATAEATTKGKMNMMLIGGVAAVVIFIIIAIGLFFFCSNSSSPPPPPPQQARTPTSSGKRKHKKKKNKKKRARTSTSGANSTTKTPEEIV